MTTEQRIWSPYQDGIFTFCEHDTGNAVVEWNMERNASAQ